MQYLIHHRSISFRAHSVRSPVGLLVDVTLRGTHVVLLLVKRSKLSALLEQNPALKPVWQRLGKLVFGEGAGGNSKHLVELLERLLLRFCAKFVSTLGEFSSIKKETMYNIPGTQKKIIISATKLNPAYKPNAPTVPRRASKKGKLILNTEAQNRHVATAKPMPISRCDKGNTSAEYVKGTGPSPGL